MATLTNFPITNFIAADMGSNISSPAISFYRILNGWSAQFVFTGSPVGVLKVQVSLDPDFLQEPTNWSDLNGATSNISAAGDILYNVSTSFYNWARFVYTRTSGSGTISGRLNIKE